MTTFKSLVIPPEATPEVLRKDIDTRVLTLVKGSKTVVFISMTNYGDREQYERVIARIVEAKKAGHGIVYFKSFALSGWRWYEIIHRIASFAVPWRMRRVGIIRRVDAIPASVLEGVAMVDLVEHLRPKRDIYRRWILNSVKTQCGFLWNPRKKVDGFLVRFQQRGLYSSEDENQVRDACDALFIDRLRRQVNEVGASIVVCIAPAGINDTAAKKLMSEDGYFPSN